MEKYEVKEPKFENNYFTEMCSGSEKGPYLRLTDFFIAQLYAECNEEEEACALAWQQSHLTLKPKPLTLNP